MRALVWFLVVVWCQTVTVIYGVEDDYIKQFVREKTFVADVRQEFVKKMEDVEEFCEGNALRQYKCWQKQLQKYCGMSEQVCKKHKYFIDNCHHRCKKEITDTVREKMYDTQVKLKCKDKCQDPATKKCLDCKNDQWNSVVTKL